MDNRWIIDSDSHVTEPRDVWTARVPAKCRTRYPMSCATTRGWTSGCSRGRRSPPSGPRRRARTRKARGPPKTYEDCHPAAYDATSASRTWTRWGSGPRSCTRTSPASAPEVPRPRRPRAADRLRRAYNDFLAEWCSADPNRLIGVMATPFWNVEETVKEVGRCHDELGFRAILFTGEPMRFGLPTLGDKAWDPFWAAAQELGMPIHFHIGGGEDSRQRRSWRSAEHHGMAGAATHAAIDLFMKNGVQCADLISSGVLPASDLRFVSVESGCGWLPFVLENRRLHLARLSRKGRSAKRATCCPRSCSGARCTSPSGSSRSRPHLLDQMPVDNLLFETDFPHNACLYGNIRETIECGWGDAPEGSARRSSGTTRPSSTAFMLLCRRRSSARKPGRSTARDRNGGQGGRRGRWEYRLRAM